MTNNEKLFKLNQRSIQFCKYDKLINNYSKFQYLKESNKKNFYLMLDYKSGLNEVKQLSLIKESTDKFKFNDSYFVEDEYNKKIFLMVASNLMKLNNLKTGSYFW